MTKEFEAVIIGSGPCGVGAGEVLAKNGIDFAIVESYIPGGKINIAPRVDNYPFEHEISGVDLAMKFAERMFNLNVPFINSKVIKLVKNNDKFHLFLEDGTELIAKAVLVATGGKEMTLGLEKEDELLGHGISYCAVCDGHFFKGKDIAVMVNGDHAVNEAIYLSNLVNKLYLIHKEKDFSESKKLIEKLAAKDNVIFFNSFETVKIVGDTNVEGLVIRDLDSKEEKTLLLQGIFPFIGQIPNSSFVEIEDVKDSNGALVVDKKFMTNCPGLFAGGDVLPRNIKQIYLSEVDGKNAGKNIVDFIRG